MRNRALQKLDMLLGNWTLTLSNAWFLDSLDTQLRGAATIEWLGDAFVVSYGQISRATGRGIS